jgi:beta-N-acetylhexosaminidase
MAPFRGLRHAEAAMTAHIVYAALDPDRPATHSPAVVNFLRTEIGFDGLLISDDIDMKALAGPLTEKAAKAFAAGCDLVIQCNGVVADMAATATGCPTLEGRALDRANSAAAVAHRAPEAFDAAAGWWRFRALMGDKVGLKPLI